MNPIAPTERPPFDGRPSPRRLAPRCTGIALLCVAVLAPVTSSAATQVYRTVDAEGRVVLSDRAPPPGTPVETIELRAPNTFLPPAGNSATADGASGAANPAAETSPYRSLRVVYPPDQAAIRENAGNVVVSAALDPGLLPGHELHLYTNGVLRERTQSSQIPLMHLDRGTHEVELRVVDSAGTTVITSGPSVFHLHRRSVILQPAPKPPPAPKPSPPSG
jgi:hypothetical protein